LRGGGREADRDGVADEVLDLLIVAERNAAYCRTDPTPALRADATLRGREASARFQRLLPPAGRRVSE
jgi:hypothetical protein